VIFADEAYMKKVEELVVKPTVAGLAKENIPYKGFLFIGLMNYEGQPYVIEYNVRMGDPETEAVLPRITSDFVGLLHGIGTGTLEDYDLQISPEYATTVVMVSGGYPESYEKGFEISLPKETPGTVVFHAGTVINSANHLVNQGGRVLAITGMGEDLETALKNAFSTVENIHWEKSYYRRDIGQDILKLSK
jgi:phosphoribosylamine---glycine ligase